MAVIAGLGPQRIASVVFILSRTRPIRLLLAYVLGGFGMTLIFGGVILFVLAEAGVGPSSVVPPEIEIAVGMVALVVAALVASGLAARVRDRSRSRHRRERGVVAGGPPTSGRQRDVTQLPGYERMPRRVQAALESESPWIAWVAGVMVGLPNLYLLAAIAAILDAGVETSSQIGALTVFSLVAFLHAVIPLTSFLVAPEATRDIADRLYAWLNAHGRRVVATLATVAGVYLLIKGISSL